MKRLMSCFGKNVKQLGGACSKMCVHHVVNLTTDHDTRSRRYTSIWYELLIDWSSLIHC